MTEEWSPELVEAVDAGWQQRFEHALETHGHAVWDWDMVNNEITWRGDCEAFGYSLKELSQEGFTWHRLLHPGDVAAMEDKVARIFAAKYPGHLALRRNWTATRKLTYRIRQKDGTYLEVCDEAKCCFDENGRATRSTGIVRRADCLDPST
jgi:PAS domain-containing protein